MRKKLKISEADNGFIVRAFGPRRVGKNALVLEDPLVKVFPGRKELEEFIVLWFSDKDMDFTNSNALQEEMFQDEGEM